MSLDVSNNPNVLTLRQLPSQDEVAKDIHAWQEYNQALDAIMKDVIKQQENDQFKQKIIHPLTLHQTLIQEAIEKQDKDNVDKEQTKRKREEPESEQSIKKHKLDEKHKVAPVITNPIDLRQCQPWVGATGPCFKCKIPECRFRGEYHDISYEVSYKLPYQNDPIYLSEVCTECARQLISRDPDMQSQKYWNAHAKLFDQLYEYGLLYPAWLEERGVDYKQMKIVEDKTATI